jgi:UDP-N-acetyl-D-mannosaminuronate dehydrogenase
VAESIKDEGPVLLLGVAYKGGIKVATLSPAIAISRRLDELEVPHCAFDPMYSAAEIEALLGEGHATTELATAVSAASTILIVPDHAEFRSAFYLDLLTQPRPDALLILDNHGVLEGVEWPAHVEYRRAGRPNWLAPPQETKCASQ